MTKDHEGCPYRCTCNKDQTKCCYLVKNRCIVNEYPTTKKETTVL